MNNGTKRKFRNCQRCDRRDSYDDMVRCDKCEDWYHYKCAGVGPEIKNFDWFCQICLKQFSETYELAKAAEDSIIRNLQATKRTALRVGDDRTSVAVCSVTSVAASSETEKLDEIILEKVDSAIAQRFGIGVVTEPLAALETMISKQVEESIGQKFGEFKLGDGGKPNDGSTQRNFSTNGDVCGEHHVGKDQGEGVGACGSVIVAEGEQEIVDLVLPVKPDQYADENLAKLNNLASDKFDDLHKKFRKKGAKKLTTTMRNVSERIIDDRVLINYSYEGAGKKKKPFKVFENVTKFIVRTTMVAYNDHHDDDDGFQKVTEKEVFDHFKTQHLKYAKQRVGNN